MRCPRCGLSVRLRFDSIRCPRCVAKAGILVPMEMIERTPRGDRPAGETDEERGRSQQPSRGHEEARVSPLA
ncbi:MAG: hypothetical protein WBQ18_20200 [Solirubrobacteraceae bacterium]